MRMSKFMRISADADPDAERRYTSTLKYYVFCSLPCLQDQISPEMVKEMSKLRALMVRKTASKRGTKKTVPTALPPSLRPSLTPHFALCDVPYEFNEPISAINTVLEAWGVP